MSWDIELQIDTGGTHPRMVCEVGNMTWNVAPMYYEAVPGGEGMRTFTDMKCSDAIPLLKEATARMMTEPETFRPMDPPNGWGDYESARDYLNRLLTACVENPLATIKIY